MYILVFSDGSNMKFTQYAIDKMVANSVARLTPVDEPLVVSIFSENDLYVILDNIFTQTEALEIVNEAYSHYLKKIFN